MIGRIDREQLFSIRDQNYIGIIRWRLVSDYYGDPGLSSGGYSFPFDFHYSAFEIYSKYFTDLLKHFFSSLWTYI